MPLGAAKAAFLGAAGSGGAVDGWELITTVTPTTGQSVTFTGIPATYHHLMVRSTMVTTGSDGKVRLGFNTTTPTSTDCWSLMNGTAGSGSPSKILNQWNYLSIVPWVRDDGPWVEEAWIYDYATTGMATVVDRRAYSGGSSSSWAQQVAYSVDYPNYIGTTAVTSLTYMFVEAAVDFAAGSQLDLYGVGAAI